MQYKRIRLKKETYTKMCARYKLDKILCENCERELKVGDIVYRKGSILGSKISKSKKGYRYRSFCEECYLNLFYDTGDSDLNDDLEWVCVDKEENKWILKKVD